ncbi:hypothetical protein M0R45_008100 [Rubus argutus]|uniref:CCHC-type domain-containing protein n=1 Tax=Rubus argutus TaxID=59490 RepID=A0AAW1Y3G7_RUBAR
MGSEPMVNGIDDFLLHGVSFGWRDRRLTLVDLLVWLFPSDGGTKGDKVVSGGACWGVPRFPDWLGLDGSRGGTHGVDGYASIAQAMNRVPRIEDQIPQNERNPRNNRRQALEDVSKQSIGKVVSRSYSPQNLVSQEPGTSQTKSTRGVNNAKAAPANPYAPPPPVKCYRCKQSGHLSNQCPQRNIHLTVHDDNENKILQEGEDDLQDKTKVTYEDEGISLVVRKLMYTPKQELNP